MRARTWSNWAGNQCSEAVRVVRPSSGDELADAIRSARADGLAVKPVGAGHSFTGAALTDGVQVDLGRLSGVIAIDRDAKTVTVGAGMRLRALNHVLAQHGLAMPNLGDVDAQTISGALSTGTHGTGAKLGCLSTFVSGLKIVTASGETLRCSATENPEVFTAARVNVGALGVITEVTLAVTEAFTLHADERPARLGDVLRDFDNLAAQNDYFEFYWFPYTDRVQVKRNNRVESSDRPLSAFRGWLDDEFLSNTVFAGACRLGRAIPALVEPISRLSSRALSARTYTAASHEVFCTPRRVRFTEMEYGLPRPAFREAFAGLRATVESMPFKIAFPVEVRVSAADDIWLSHGYGRDSAYIAIHQYAGMPYEPYMRAFEKIAADLGGRPHWGKLNWRDVESLAGAYPRFSDFLAVRDKLDPDRAFANDYTRRIFGP
jgi:L-gulono-1,4-lactone dehydrogenase